MPQIFPKKINPIIRFLLVGLPIMAGGTGVGLAAFYRSSYTTGVNEIIPQPVAFSHMHHVGQLGIDCRYCHSTVETSNFANIPATKVCMNCHQAIWTGSDVADKRVDNLLAPVRESYKNNTPIVWNRVHNVPNYAYFNHSIHIAKGVGCQSCHGQVDEMNLTMQSKTLLMEWCVACHRAPENHLRPKSEVFSMTYKPGQEDKAVSHGHEEKGKPAVWKLEDFGYYGKKPDGSEDPHAKELVGKPRPTDQKELGKLLKELYEVRDALTMTGCSMCHR